MTRYVLYAAAMERKKAEATIVAQYEALWEHIIKYLLFEDPTSRTSWIRTINGILLRIRRIKIKGGAFSAEDYYNMLFDDWSAREELEIKEMRQELRKEMPSLLMTSLTDEEIWRKLSSIIKALSSDLERKQEVSIQTYLD